MLRSLKKSTNIAWCFRRGSGVYRVPCAAVRLAPGVFLVSPARACHLLVLRDESVFQGHTGRGGLSKVAIRKCIRKVNRYFKRAMIQKS